jgi:hypothetical protein
MALLFSKLTRERRGINAGRAVTGKFAQTFGRIEGQRTKLLA